MGERERRRSKGEREREVGLTQARGHVKVVKNQSENCLNQLFAKDNGIMSVKKARKKYTPVTHWRKRIRKYKK